MTKFIARARGVRGPGGWAPVLGSEVDGERRVLVVLDWTGGTGTKPAAPRYVGADGLTTDIAEAQDARGGVGASAYEAAASAGFVGSEVEWLASLVGGQQVDLSFNASGQYVAGEIITLGELASAFEIDPDLAVVKADTAPTGNAVITIHIGGEVVAGALVGGQQVGSAAFTAPGKTAAVTLTQTSWPAGALRLVGPTPADDSLADLRGVFTGLRA